MKRIGLIGAGKNGQGNIAKLAAENGRCCIVAVADLDESLAGEAAGPYGARVTTDYTTFLDDVDAVVISSPNFLHPEHAVVCAKAGKHVWIEKPMALNTVDADRIVDAVESTGVESFVGFSVRFDAALQSMKRCYDDGMLGGLISLWSRRMSFSQPSDRPNWRTDFKTSGGLISELLAHEIDWILELAGMPEVVFCRKTSRRQDDERANEHVWLTMGFGDDVTGTIEGSSMTRMADYYRGIAGDKASAYTTEWGQRVVLHGDRNEVRHLDLSPSFNKHAHFLDVIEGKRESVADVRCGRRVVHVTEKALESVVTGEAVKVGAD